MRKFALGLVLAGALSLFANAQGGPDAMSHPSTQGVQASPFQGQGQARTSAQAITVEGKLGFEDGLPVLIASEATYSLDMPDFFYYAYFDGLKVGDGVKADGYLLPAAPGGGRSVMLVAKAVIGGKTYDLGAGAGSGFSLGGGPAPLADSRGGKGGRH